MGTAETRLRRIVADARDDYETDEVFAAAWALAEIDRLRAERDYCRSCWHAAMASYLVFGHNIDRERAEAETDAQIAAALRAFRDAAGLGPEGGAS